MTLVVEAADPSGSPDHRGRSPRDLGRDVAAVPGPGHRAAWPPGPTACSRDGAVLVTSAEDVLDELYGVGLRPSAVAAERAARADPALTRRARRGGGGARRRRDRGRRPGWPSREVRAALGRLEADRARRARLLGGWERAATERRTAVRGDAAPILGRR